MLVCLLFVCDHITSQESAVTAQSKSLTEIAGLISFIKLKDEHESEDDEEQIPAELK